MGDIVLSLVSEKPPMLLENCVDAVFVPSTEDEYMTYEGNRTSEEELKSKSNLIVDSTHDLTGSWLGPDIASVPLQSWDSLAALGPNTQASKTPTLPYPASSTLVTEVESTEYLKSNQSSPSHTCPHCQRSFTRAAILRDHVRTHTAERPFECSVCRKAFARKNDMRRHEQLHNNTRKHICDGCGKQFARSHSLQEHKKGRCGHIYPRKPSGDAQICDGGAPSKWSTPVFDTPNLLIYDPPAHPPNMISEKLEDPLVILGKHICTLPHPLQFDNNEKFEEHMCKVHEWVLPLDGYFDCRVEHPIQTTCTLPHRLEFNSMQELKDHMTNAHGNRSHNDIILRSGERCDTRQESQNGDVQIRALMANTVEIRNHEKYHYCIVCPSRYEQKVCFAQHLLRHLDDMERCPYFCRKCNRSFPMLEHLKWHENHCVGPLLLPETLYFCERWGCDQVFESKFALGIHLNGNGSAFCDRPYPTTERAVRTAIVEKMRDLSPDSHNQIGYADMVANGRNIISFWHNIISRWEAGPH